MLERGIDARHASSCKRPISGYLQAEPRMPRVINLQFGTMGFVSRGCITTFGRIRHWIETRRPLERSSLRRMAGSFQSHKSAAWIIVTDEPHNVGDPVNTGMSIKSMEGMSARTEINTHCCRAMRRQRELESSIRIRDRRRIIREWALHRQDGIFGTDRVWQAPDCRRARALSTMMPA